MPRLEQGMTAPNFELRSVQGEEVRLRSLTGKKVWLCFYRYLGCPLCSIHLHRIVKNFSLLSDHGIQVIAIADTDPRRFPADAEKLKTTPFPVILDPSKTLYRLYSAEKSLLGVLKPQVLTAWLSAAFKGFRQGRVTGELGQLPAHFLIREDGIIHTAYYGTHAADHLPEWRLERFLAEESVTEWKARRAGHS